MISFLIQEAVKYGYVGWQFDFEHMSYRDRDAYSAFTKKAATALHDNNMVISVAVSARINDDVSTDFYKNWSGAFDYAQIASSTDFISIMAYDDPDSTGPSAALPYVRAVLDYLSDKVPQHKISIGIPLYDWKWNTDTQKGSTGVSYTELQYVKGNYRPFQGFNISYQVPYLVYSDKGYIYIVWYEDADSIRAKLGIMKTYDIRGFSAWVLGVEDPGVWGSIGSN